eukprot:gene7869-13747_t
MYILFGGVAAAQDESNISRRPVSDTVVEGGTRQNGNIQRYSNFSVKSCAEIIEKSKRDINHDHSVSQETNKLAKAAKNNFKLMSEYISSPTNYRFDPQGNKLMQNKLQQNKLKQEFENSLSRYQAIQNVLSVKLKSHIDEELHLSPVKHDVSQDNFNDSDDTLLINDVEQQAQLHAEEQELEAIKERENRFRQIETDILDVNEIFRDLAVIIHEQGDSIDSIEGNVEQAVVHVRDANVQLQRAKDYQKSARKRLCIICIVAFVAAGIIGLIIYLSEKQNLSLLDCTLIGNLYAWEILESETAFKHIQASPASTNLTAISINGNHFTFASGVWFQTNYSVVGPNESIKTWNEDFNVTIFVTESGKIYCLHDSPNVPYFIGNTSSSVSVIIAKLNEGSVPFLEVLLSETQTITLQVYVRVFTANAKDISCTFSNYSCWLLVGNSTIQYFQWHSPLGKMSLLANFNITGYSFSSISAYQNEVWLIAADGATAWRRLGVTLETPIGTRWMVFTLYVPFRASKVTIGPGGIYVLLNGGVVAKYQGFEQSSAQTPSTMFEIDTYDDGKLLGIVETGQMIQSSIVNATPTSFGNLVVYDAISKIWTAPSGLVTHELKNIAVGESTVYALRKGINAYPHQIGLGLNSINNLFFSFPYVYSADENDDVYVNFYDYFKGTGASNILFMIEDNPSDTHLYCDTFVSEVPYLRIEDQNATSFGHFAFVSCGEAHCWGINNNGTSAFISLKPINPCSENLSDSHLRLIDEGITFKTIDTSKNGDTWAVEAKTNDAFIRLGVDTDTVNGTMWAPIPGVSLRDVAVGRDIVYGIGVNGEFFHLALQIVNFFERMLEGHSEELKTATGQAGRYGHNATLVATEEYNKDAGIATALRLNTGEATARATNGQIGLPGQLVMETALLENQQEHDLALRQRIPPAIHALAAIKKV